MHNFFDFYNTTSCRTSPEEIIMLRTESKKIITLEFTHNWNGKLFADHFNELTMYSPEYRPGLKMEVLLNSVSLGFAKIAAMRNYPFGSLNDLVSYLSLGKDTLELQEQLTRRHGRGKPLDRDAMVTHLVCGWVERNMENQNLLITQWWLTKQENPML